MRGSFLLVVLVLAALPGCGLAPTGALVAAEAASIVVMGRGIVDIGVSAVSGRDCSLVRLDRGLSYCGPGEERGPEAYCTRTLGTVDCWASPKLASSWPGLGDTPAAAGSRERHRAARWPKALVAEP